MEKRDRDRANRPFRPSISTRDASPAHDPLTAHRYEAHRPRTPPTEIAYVEESGRAHPQAKGTRAPRARPAIATVFPDVPIRLVRQTPPEGDQERRSHSHELSFHPSNNARDSLVDQILLSLDSPSADFDDYNLLPDHTRPSADPRRNRGHTYSSSTSSGFLQFVRDRSRSRGRHSKNKSSGSNFQTNTDIIGSAYTSPQQRVAPVERSYTEPKSSFTGRAGKFSTKSGTEYGQFSTQQRRAARRSISLDQVRQIVQPGATETYKQGAMDADRAQSPENDGADATHSIGGALGQRRRGHNGSVGSINSQSLRPSRSNTTGLRRPGTSPQRPGVASDNTMQATEDVVDGASTVTLRQPRNQAPTVPTNIRPKVGPGNTYKAMAFSPNATVSKEKGGFFKRMFGGSSKGPGATDAQAQQPPQASQASSIRTASHQELLDDSSGIIGQATSMPPPGAKSEPKEPATLNKKASFFRRRKKSIAAPAPAVPILPSAWQDNGPSRDHSPASSLRKVMNPYLSNSRPGTRTGRAGSKLDAAPSLDRSGEVRLYPMQDSGQSHGFESSTHAYPAPSPFPASNQRAAYRDGPDEYSLLDQDQPVDIAATSDNVVETSEVEERVSRRKTITAAPTSGSAPKRESSKGWRDRPQTRVLPVEQSRRSASDQRRPEVNRTETETSEVSDSDFASAKSQVVSPTDDQESPFARPPLPAASPPSVPMVMSSSTSRPVGEGDRSLLAANTTNTATANKLSTLDPARTPAYNVHDTSEPAEQRSQEEKPTDEDYTIADQLFRFNSDGMPDGPSLPSSASEICPWLGEAGEERARVRKAYLEMFNWKDTSILTALRKFCEHVKLKGETQQVDRVLEAIARQWTECNSSHGFKAVDVVHTICYSLLLLNTDLHVADIENRMTRSQFVKNTMQTVTRVIDDAVPDAFKQSTINAAKRASALPPKPTPLDLGKTGLGAFLDPTSPRSPHSPASLKESGTVKLTIRRNSNEFQRNKYRLTTRPSDNTAIESLLGEIKTKGDGETPVLATEDCGPLVKQQFFGGRAAWENQLETVLKNFYNGIQKQRLPLQGSDNSVNRDNSRAPSSLGGQQPSSNKIGRSASISSRQSGGDRVRESRPTTGTTSKWRNKIGQRPRIYAASNFSVDDDMSMNGISPSASSLWSKHSIGRTQTSMSVTSFRSEAPGHEAYQQSIGFANALSQAIIREENAADGADADEKDSEAIKAASLLDDDSLELYGAPWAKEGIVKHKHHLEAVDKKAKERAWTECFAVIQKGWLQLFRFNSTKSMRARALRAAVGGIGGGHKGTGPGGKVVVGGGNWMDNALPLGRYLLRQVLASALPPPGYSKSRPHVWALSLPNGAVHLFQAGTPEIVREYVTCANYWSARLSKEPLVGGISNVEYGWSENLLSNAIVAARPGSRNDAAPSSMAEALAMSRQRSGSSDQSAAPAPGVPRTSSRSVGQANRPPSAMHSARPSLQNSIRNSFDTTASAVVRPRLPGDHAKIAEWTPPQQSMVASALLEVDQLRVLSDYVANIKRELEKHNELRSAIQLAYGPRHPNHAKAMANFERKSAYLLREIVKFSTYVETLQTAQTKKGEVLKEREDRKKEMDAERAKDDAEKVETAEELRRELSRSDLRMATKATSEEPEDVPEVPALPDTGVFTKS